MTPNGVAIHGDGVQRLNAAAGKKVVLSIGALRARGQGGEGGGTASWRRMTTRRTKSLCVCVLSGGEASF